MLNFFKRSKAEESKAEPEDDPVEEENPEPKTNSSDAEWAKGMHVMPNFREKELSNLELFTLMNNIESIVTPIIGLELGFMGDALHDLADVAPFFIDETLTKIIVAFFNAEIELRRMQWVNVRNAAELFPYWALAGTMSLANTPRFGSVMNITRNTDLQRVIVDDQEDFDAEKKVLEANNFDGYEQMSDEDKFRKRMYEHMSQMIDECVELYADLNGRDEDEGDEDDYYDRLYACEDKLANEFADIIVNKIQKIISRGNY